MGEQNDSIARERERAIEVVRSEVMRHKLAGYPMSGDVMELIGRILDRLEAGK
jgi:hypothetical protein